MDNVLLMHVGNPLQDLLHVVHTRRLRVLKVVIHNTFKEFATCNTADKQNSSDTPENTRNFALLLLCALIRILTTPSP